MKIKKDSEAISTSKIKKFKFKIDRLFHGIFSWFVLVLAAGICGYAIIAFCFQTVTVVGPSMNETLEDGQVVLVNKLAYKYYYKYLFVIENEDLNLEVSLNKKYYTNAYLDYPYDMNVSFYLKKIE